MNLISKYKEDAEKLNKMVKYISSEIEKLPNEWLKINKSKNSVSYYKVCPKTRKAEYIQKNNLELAQKLAQRSYYIKLIPVIKRELGYLKNYSIKYDKSSLDRVYTSMSDERQSLVIPIQPTLEQRIKEWKSIPYNSLGFKEYSQEIYTNKGERVRSKSEKIYADLLFSLGIEYKYEAPLKLKNGKIRYPDFTIIDPKTGEEVYCEHLGMMDTPEYAINAMKKIEEYEKNGIILGENLLLSFEGDNYSTNFDMLKNKLIERFVI